MIAKSELLRVPAFADLPDDQITWFLSQSQEMHLKAGETYVRQGEPADAMFVILEGQFQWRGEFVGGTVVLFRQHARFSAPIPSPPKQNRKRTPPHSTLTSTSPSPFFFSKKKNTI